MTAKLISPNTDVAQAYLRSASPERLATQILQRAPWFYDQIESDFLKWSRNLLARQDFPATAVLHLVGSAANGFSLSPEKPGAPFRKLPYHDHPSDLDFCLVDNKLFMQIWNSMVKEDHLLGPQRRQDLIRVRVYWGRIEQYVIPPSKAARVRRLADAIRRTPECRGYRTSIRVYRRRKDLKGYTLSCLAKLKKAIER